MRGIWNWLTQTDSEMRGKLLQQPLSDALLQSQLPDLVHRSEFKRAFEQVIAQMQSLNKKSLALLSLEPSEGKTLLTSLIAFGYAEFLNERVLIIDAQTSSRSSSLHLQQIFETDEASKLAGIRRTFQLNIDILELATFESKRASGLEYHVDALLDSVGEDYGLILIDTSAINSKLKNSFDPIVLANRADASLLVVSDKTLGARAISSLKSKPFVQAQKVLGVLYNEREA